MRKNEQDVLEKVRQDFSEDIKVLEKNLDNIERCVELLQREVPYLQQDSLSERLIETDDVTRRKAVYFILIKHSYTFLVAARLLLVTGYISPSLSCLRTAYESFHSGHICGSLDAQAKNFIQGKPINKKAALDYPVHLNEGLSRQMKRTLSEFGVHSSYHALENQARFEGSIFIDENYETYRFIFVRNIWSFEMMVALLLDYLFGNHQDLVKRVDQGPELLRELMERIARNEKRLLRE